MARLLLLPLLLLLACGGSEPPQASEDANATPGKLAPPLVDGDCQEYAGLGVESINLTEGVDLFLFQDSHYVWLCYTYPPNSFGTMDLVLETDTLPASLNLHVSAQIGEWPADQKDEAPQDPESDKWWNARGWMANPVWINGMDTSGDKPRYRFKNAPAREVQLSKERFGRGDWRFSLNIRAIRGPDGMFQEVNFPQDGGRYTLKTAAGSEVPAPAHSSGPDRPE